MQFLLIYSASLPALLPLGTFDLITRQLLRNCTATYCSLREIGVRRIPHFISMIEEGVLKVNLLKDDEDAIIYRATQDMLENTVVYRFLDMIDLSIFGEGMTTDTFFISGEDSKILGLQVSCRVLTDE